MDAIKATHNAKDLVVSDECPLITKRFEGCVLEAYQDTGGVWTIGYGHTGSDVTPGMVIDMDTALQLLKQDLNEHADYVREAVSVPITQYQFDALADWTFNLGGHALMESTLLSKVNASASDDEIAYEFMRWVYDNGQWLHGLTKRRQAEALLFCGMDSLDFGEWKSYNKRRYKKWLNTVDFKAVELERYGH